MAREASLASRPWEMNPGSYLEEDPEHSVFRGRRYPNPASPPTLDPEDPNAEYADLLKRSTSGSPPFTAAEIAQGYRKIKG